MDSKAYEPASVSASGSGLLLLFLLLQGVVLGCGSDADTGLVKEEEADAGTIEIVETGEGGAISEIDGGRGPETDGEPSCLLDELEEGSCGHNGAGVRRRTCLEGGRWSEWGDCTDPDECEEGAGDAQACGRNGRGLRTRVCREGRWGEWELCHDPDECEDGQLGDGPCGLNGRGLRSRPCTEGRWGEWGGCTDPDECRDGEEDLRFCPTGNGLQLRSCREGVFGPWSECPDHDLVLLPDDAGGGATCVTSSRDSSEVPR